MTPPIPETKFTGWLSALERLRPTPEPHREEQVPREPALLLLRCGENVLNDLCDHGLPHSGIPPEEYYDLSDLTNLALMSKSNRSLPELGASFISRIAGAGPKNWVSPRRWLLQIRALALHSGECGEDPSWTFRRPTPESFGGRCLEWNEGGTLPVVDTRAIPREDAPSTLNLTGRVLTRGEVRVVRSSILRKLYRELLESMEFLALPPSLSTDVEATLKSKGADCVGISILLEHECRRAGYHAVAKHGYLLGLLGIAEHCWLEVVDDDGRIKILDPTLPMVARISLRFTPGFTAFCLGSISNRLLPFGSLLEEQIIEHSCGGAATPVHTIIAIRHGDSVEDF